NGEIHILNGVPENKYDIVEEDEKLTLQQNESNGVSYLSFNMEDQKREVSSNVKLRQAVLYSINQKDIIDFYQENKMSAVSTVSPLVDTGLKLEADSEKVEELLQQIK